MGRCVIIGAGQIDDYGYIKSFIKPNDTVICADGGYIHAEKMNLKISCIVGDFDSSKKPDFENIITLPVEKDVTDTFYCAKEFTDRGFDDYLLLGMSGGRLDHTYANIQTLFYLSKRNCRAEMIDEKNKIFVITENEYTVTFAGYDNISFFSLFENVKNLEIRNAKYNISSYDLSLSDPLCVSNSFVNKNDIYVKKSSGTLLVVESK